jgi:hypothetical protein
LKAVSRDVFPAISQTHLAYVPYLDADKVLASL